ncbi:aminoacyl-tRNA hydrolase [bacterium]|nr:aminoacyl-tRNA hydrolase [bacterium]
MGRRLVVGLGNPGPEYESTWHNLGFHTVRQLATKLKVSLRTSGDALVGRGRYAGHDIFLMLPQSYMNLSGKPVSKLARGEGIDADEILVILDDHDLPRGMLRMRTGGGDGGHRGLRSIQNELGGQQVGRLRIGIRDEELDPEAGGYEDLADRVLDTLDENDVKHLEAMATAAARASLDWISVGPVGAMNRHNGLRIAPPG